MARIVDTNPHLVAADKQKYEMTPLGSLPVWAEGDAHLSVEEYLAHMDTAGVDQATLVHPSNVYGFNNSYCADSAAGHPDRFTGVGAIDVNDPKAAESMHYWVEERGMTTVRFEAPGESGSDCGWLGVPTTSALWQEAQKLGILVSLASVRMDGLPALKQVLPSFSNVPVLLRRLADVSCEDGPPYNDAQELFDLAKFPNVYMTFSVNNINAAKKGSSTPEAFFGDLLGRFGADHFMWGSFFPANQATPEAPCKGLLDQIVDELSFLPADDRDWMMGEAARKAYPALATAV